ncbi:MAG TPA: FAD binding domain-containing protein [Roseiflexaceae bacterium]|nr:FAD binding domain-containing protein [Roseiflexaceae bacterium]
MWQTYYQPQTLDEALELLAHLGGEARIVAGGTDVLVELSRGVRPTSTLIDISQIAALKYIRHDADWIRLGALATHNDVLASEACRRFALPLAQACLEVGAPPIRTRATVAGNLVTASPANDTIAPLLALEAELVLARAGGERTVPLASFYPAFRTTLLQPGELVREIRFRPLAEHQRGLFVKLGLRRAQAISVIDLALVLTVDTSAGSALVRDARIALGCVAPTVIRAAHLEAFLQGRALDETTCRMAGDVVARDAAPINDIRGTAAYRQTTLANLVRQALRRIANGDERAGWPERIALLETPPVAADSAGYPASQALESVDTTINGVRHSLPGSQRMTLLNMLRSAAGLTGTKEGCAEGECGACVVWLNGQAVMACLTPAAQAHGTAVTTIEGLNGQQANGELHPLQAAFIRNAAVQCGYCIPGMLMSGAKLLDEHHNPERDLVRSALSGNICRCTGYRKIVDAVLDAATIVNDDG